MNRTALIMIVAAAEVLCTPAAAFSEALSTLRVDFSGGIPAAFTLEDRDGRTPSVDMSTYGFSVGTTWIVRAEESDPGNMVAVSTSWYSPAGAADDWMITPALAVEPESRLRFRARAYDGRFSDGFVVRVADADSEAYTDLLTVTAEKPQWQLYDISLAEYAGQEVKIAIVNNSNNCSRLYIDDLYFGAPVVLQSDARMERIVEPGAVPVHASATNISDTPVSGFTATYSDGSTSFEQRFDVTIEPGESYDFTFDQPLQVEANSTLSLTIGVTAAGLISQDLVTLSGIHHSVLLEEGTGTWCGWCVRGIVYLDRYVETYGNLVTPIAVHGGGGREPMREDYYSPSLESVAGSSYPLLYFNRTSRVDPNAAAPLIEAELKKPAEFGLEVIPSVNEDAGSIDVEVTVYPVFDAVRDMRVAIALVEDDVYHPDDPEYAQHNSYFDGKSGEMGGYENLPEYVPAEDMHYRHVARTINEFHGQEGCLPERFTARAPESFTTTIDIPGNVDHLKNLHVVAILLDGTTRRAVNTLSVPAVADLNGIETLVETPTQTPDAIYDLRGIRVTRPQSGRVYIRLTGGRAEKVIF